MTPVVEYQGTNAVAFLDFQLKDPFLKESIVWIFLDLYLSAVEREEGKIEKCTFPTANISPSSFFRLCNNSFRCEYANYEFI